MALTRCDECGYEITVNTDRCFNCGEPVKRSIIGYRALIRRIILAFLAVIAFLTAIKYF